MTVFSFTEQGAGGGPVPEEVIERIGRVKERCDAEEIELLLENSARCWGNTGKRLLEIAKKVGVGITWDPANAAAAGADAYPKGYNLIKEFISHVHFKNWHPDRGNVAIMDGIVDMKGQVAALKGDGYNDYYCVEHHQWDDQARATKVNADQLLSLLTSSTTY